MNGFDSVEEALEELRNGKIILVTDDPDRENEGDFICAAEFATTENINFMATHGKGLICMPMSEEYVRKLQFPQMVAENSDNHETAFTVSVDHISTTTGISAAERSVTAMKCVDENAKPEDFRRPGHMFPLLAKKNGVLERNGHTEATVDLCRLAGLKQCGLCCEIMREDGTMMRTSELWELAEKCPFAVTFAGKITQQELAKKMNQSDVFVLPSFYEGLPLVIIEALACGTYVICTDLPGIRNWIDQNLPDNGVVFVEPPKRVNEDEPVEEELPVFEKKLAGAIEGIAKYPGSKPEKEHLEQISWDGLCVHLMQIFEQQSVYRKNL